MRKLQLATIAALLIVLGMLWYVRSDRSVQEVENSGHEVQNFQINFLDIGQGDATFITFADGQQMLIDCAIDARIIEALGRAMDFYDRTIDYLVVTHPDLDHYGGCVDVLKRFEISHIIVNGFRKPWDDYWQEYWSTVLAEQVLITTIDREDVWQVASTTIHWLYPDHSLEHDPQIPGIEKEVDSNNTSIVMKISVGEIDFLLTGDAEHELEEYIVATYDEQLHAEVYKASHHGSGGSSIQSLVDVVQPLHTVFSAGRENTFGHPSRRVIRRVERASSTVWRTDTQGDILMSITEGVLSINGTELHVDEHAASTTYSGSSTLGDNQE